MNTAGAFRSSSAPTTSFDEKYKIECVLASAANKTCVDCGFAKPDWVSLSFGTIICVRCAGRHRSLGVHITSVRSARLDSFTDFQILQLQTGGNDKFKTYLDGIADLSSAIFEEKYRDPRILRYRHILKGDITGEDPTLLEEAEKEKYDDDTDKGKMPVKELASPPSSSSRSSSASGPPVLTWAPDNTATNCMVCGRQFTLFTRRHHCRRCGKCICVKCAPHANTRPILEWGYTQPVRHCCKCYRSPAVDWT